MMDCEEIIIVCKVPTGQWRAQVRDDHHVEGRTRTAAIEAIAEHLDYLDEQNDNPNARRSASGS